jgi:hypothetical protein
MSHPHGTYLGGVQSVEDLRKRCRIDEVTGCWHWGLARDKSTGGAFVWVRTQEGTKRKMRGRRAAVLLSSGKDLQPGHVAYPRLFCKSDDCCNPDHSRSGSRKQWGEYLTATGQAKSPAKTASNRAIVRSKLAKLSIEIAREIRLSPESTYALARKYGVAQSCIWSIKQGKAWKEHLPGSSIFAMALHRGNA